MNGLLVVLARPGLRIASKIDAHEPGARSTRNKMPAFRAIRIPPGPKEAHDSHTGAVDIRFHRDLRGVLLIEGIQLPRTGTLKALDWQREVGSWQGFLQKLRNPSW